MPTLNPRLNVTLSPSLYDLVGRLAGLQRVSRANVLRELLEASAPSLARAVALMEAAQRAKPELLRGLAASMASSQDRIEEVMERALATIERQGDLIEEAEGVHGRRPRRAAARATVGENPPASNRGVKSVNPRAAGRKKAARS
jgi:hypothetical protein